MEGAQGTCKECGKKFFVDSENCGTDESLCEKCSNWFQIMGQAEPLYFKEGFRMLCASCKFFYDDGSELFGGIETCGHNPMPGNVSDLLDDDTNECIYFCPSPENWLPFPSKLQWQRRMNQEQQRMERERLINES